MKEEIFNNEYIDNKKQVYDILKNKDIKLLYVGVNDMYQYKLIINGVCFDYFEGLGHEILTKENTNHKIISAIDCVLKDADTINFFKTIDKFMLEFGYLDYIKALEVFNGCKRNKIKLAKCFTRQELNILTNNINL